MEGTPPFYTFSATWHEPNYCQGPGFQGHGVQAPSKKPTLTFTPLEETVLFLSSGWRALMSCCQPVLTSPDVGTTTPYKGVPSYRAGVDEEEVSFRTQFHTYRRIAYPRAPRETNPQPGSAALPSRRWTTKVTSGQCYPQPAGDKDQEGVELSFLDQVVEGSDASRTYRKSHRVTRPRSFRGRVFPDKATLLSDLQLSRSETAAYEAAVVHWLFDQEDDEHDYEDIENYSIVTHPQNSRGKGRQTQRRSKPIPLYEAVVEHVHYLPEDESTIDEVTGIPYFISDINIDDVCFYRITENNRRIAHARTARETAILKNSIANACRGKLPQIIKDDVHGNLPICDATPMNNPTLVVRMDEEDPDVQSDTPGNHNVALARTSRRNKKGEQAGTEKRCRYRVILRHKMITYSSESAEAYDEQKSGFPLLSPVYEEEADSVEAYDEPEGGFPLLSPAYEEESDSAEAYDEPEGGFPLLSPVYEEDADSVEAYDEPEGGFPLLSPVYEEESDSAEAYDEPEGAVRLLSSLYGEEPSFVDNLRDDYCPVLSTVCEEESDFGDNFEDEYSDMSPATQHEKATDLKAALRSRLHPATPQETDESSEGDCDLSSDSNIYWRGSRQMRPPRPFTSRLKWSAR